MGRIIFDTATTFNGWIADEDNSLDWLFAVENGTQPEEGLYPADAAVIVMGRTTYQWMLDHEQLLDHPERWAANFADTPVFVFANRELQIPAGADVRVVSGEVDRALPAIREAAGDRDIWIFGGAELVGQFLDAGALDRIALSFAPAALTGGAPLFARRIEADRLRLVEARAIGQFARVVYDVLPARAPLD